MYETKLTYHALEYQRITRFQSTASFVGPLNSQPKFNASFYANVDLLKDNLNLQQQKFPSQLHSSEKDHDPETCRKCRKATKYLLDLSNCEEIKWNPNESQIDEFMLFNSNLKFFNDKKLQTSNNIDFQFARSSNRFSKESYVESRDESWTNQFKQFDEEINSGTYIWKEHLEKQQEKLPWSLDEPMIDRNSSNGHSEIYNKPWKKLVSIDPALSPRYDQVFPALSAERKQQIVYYNATVCVFCRNNNEPPELFLSHTVKDPRDGRTTCPILRKYKCLYCNATGDNAHTKTHCPRLAMMLEQRQMQLLINAQHQPYFVVMP